MESFMPDLAKSYVEKLIKGALVESSYICCFTCIAKDFEEEKARLVSESKTIKERVEVATNRGEDIQSNVDYWEKEADKLIQEDTKTNQKCCFGFCPNCIWRYIRGKELANKKDRIKELMKTGKELSIGLPARLPGVESNQPQFYISFKSRESIYNELLDALKDDNNYIIGLQGMGGTGKTTLAIKVGNELEQSKQFTKAIITTVSNSPDIKKIQDDIAGPLGLNLNDDSESDRPKKLWKRLTQGEKILLILDDVWGDLDFKEIGIPYNDNNKGCRVLVTTRQISVCNRMGCNKTIQLELLSEEDAWNMFKRHAGLCSNSSKSLLGKAHKIANECKRLPIAIAAIASSLKGEQRPEEWDAALKSLQKHMSMRGGDDGDELDKIYKCLKFSYDNMKNEKAKRLFLLCSVFQEDENIPIERLTRFGIGAGIFGEDYDSYEDARSQVVISKNKLLDSCLLLKANQEESVKMHDLVRDAAQRIAKKKIQTINISNKNEKALVERENNIKYLLCQGKLMDVLSCKFGGYELEILIVYMHEDGGWDNVNVEFPNTFFGNNTGLRVFHILFDFNFYKPTLPFIQSIQSLKNIRSFLFENVNLGDISILGNMHSLETLDLVSCKINELPHGITKLEKLRLLNLDSCEILRNNPFEVIKGCSLLEELYFLYSFNIFCQEISFPKLKIFHIKDNFTSRHSPLIKCVSVIYFERVLSESTLKYCMQTAEVLQLRRIEKGWRNLMPEIVPVDQVPNVYSKLVILDLYKLENLEELCNGHVSFDSFGSLEKLSIKACEHLQSLFKCNLNLCNLKSILLEECPMLISLFQQKSSRSLVLLEKLELIDCKRLEYIIINERKWEESSDDDNDSMSRGSLFPKLKVLYIEKCPNFELILPFLSAHDLPALESITMQSCDKLKYIFGQNVKLDSLNQMKLGSLPNFIDIFPQIFSSIKEPSSISRDTSKSQTQSLPIKGNIFSWISTACTKIPPTSDDEQQDCLISSESSSYCLNYNIWEHVQCFSRQSQILCNIKDIQLTNIAKIKSVFILFIVPRMLLETLTIENCDELKHIIIDTEDHDSCNNNLGNVLPKLKNLNVRNCVELEYIFGHYVDDHQNHIEIHIHLPALECLVLQNLPSLAAMCSKQYHITFPPLKELEFQKCDDVAFKSIGDFLTHHSITRSVDRTTMKELSGNVEYFQKLEILDLSDSKIGYIFWLDEIDGQEMNTGLTYISLYNMSGMTCPFVGPKNYIFLKSLTQLVIMHCKKLEIVFSTSVSRCLPQLQYLTIKECKELKHIIEDDLENKKSSKFPSTNPCFPKLELLYVVNCNNLKCICPSSMCKDFPKLYHIDVEDCVQLEYIVGPYSDDHQNHTEIHIHFLALEYLYLVNLPSLVAMCPKQYGTTFPCLKLLKLNNCSKVDIKSIGDFITPHSLTRSMDGASMKELSGKMDHVNEKQMNIKLENIKLHTLALMTSLFLGPKNSFALQNLRNINIVQCEKLEIIFSNSILRCLPQLQSLIIEECKELKHIIEDDTENQKTSNSNSLCSRTCFPKLEALAVVKCNKLKSVFPVSICKELPELKVLMIKEANELEEIFKSECDNQKVEVPNLKIVAFVNLPSLCQNQGIQFQAVENRFVQNCQNLSLTCDSTTDSKINIFHISYSNLDYETCLILESLFAQLQEEYEGSDTGSEGPSTKTTKDFAAEIEVEAASEHKLTFSQELMNEQLMDPLGEIDNTVKPSQFLKEIEDSSTSEKCVAATLSTISETKNDSPIQLVASKQKDTEISVEEGTTLTPSTHLILEQDVDVIDSVETTKTNNDKVSVIDDAVMKVSSIIEKHFPKDDVTTVSESKPSPSNSIPLSLAFQTPSEGNPSQIVQDLSSTSLVTWELEQLVSNKHLNYENLSVLTDFLVKHPSVLLRDSSVSNRYKGYAYNCLAELLKFLQTHSVLDVLGSSHSEFVELLQDMRRFAFDKDWLDDVEKRALFPNLQFSQDALQKLLDSQQRVTKEVEEIRLKINIFTQHVGDLKKQLASYEAFLETIMQEKAKVLETKAALSSPIGY
ncbi:uncharacterized protein [Cicer arietinum]|uniref:Uncharacterized protein LOC101500233 isoform X2 n=1 Tax=Cicer arietinum TaxID=3827 RepID=A0A1S2Y8J0_CICAR|nr:uncharacterized protein LOC101500233 isoform X2 [Cicer arietinum]